MSKQPDRRQELANIESEVAAAIANGHFQPSGNWFMSLFAACFMIGLPIGFVWACLDFSLEVNAFNIGLCFVTSLLIFYTIKRIVNHARHRHELIKVFTNLSDKDNNRLFADAAEELGYRIYDYNKHRTRDASKLKMAASKSDGYRIPNKEITALFSQGTIYLHAQTVLGGDENILLNHNKQMIKELVEILNKHLHVNL
jgi:hypothetical protein